MAKCKNWYINIERFGDGIFHCALHHSLDLGTPSGPKGPLTFSVLYFKRALLKSLIFVVGDILTKWM